MRSEYMMNELTRALQLFTENRLWTAAALLNHQTDLDKIMRILDTKLEDLEEPDDKNARRALVNAKGFQNGQGYIWVGEVYWHIVTNPNHTFASSMCELLPALRLPIVEEIARSWEPPYGRKELALLNTPCMDFGNDHWSKDHSAQYAMMWMHRHGIHSIGAAYAAGKGHDLKDMRAGVRCGLITPPGWQEPPECKQKWDDLVTKKEQELDRFRAESRLNLRKAVDDERWMANGEHFARMTWSRGNLEGFHIRWVKENLDHVDRRMQKMCREMWDIRMLLSVPLQAALKHDMWQVVPDIDMAFTQSVFDKVDSLLWEEFGIHLGMPWEQIDTLFAMHDPQQDSEAGN